MNKPKVLCFGELLYRIQSSGALFGGEETIVEMFPGGSEANVAVALAQLDVDSYYMSSGPNNALVNNILGILKESGVDVTRFRFEGDRLGSYILLGANGLTSGEVIYDRKYSSFSQLQVNTIDWDVVFDGIDWFHWTALTPALSADHAELCYEAILEARKRNLTISVDLNYRSKLWQYGQDPIDVMPRLVRECDLIMGNIWASNKMLGTQIEEFWSGDRTTLDYPAISKVVAQEVFEKYPRCKDLAFTFRFMDNAKHNLFYATYHTPENDYVSDVLETHNLVDRIGSGDAFMGGVIAAVVKGLEGQELISFATEIGYKKLFVKGDFIKIK